MVIQSGGGHLIGTEDLLVQTDRISYMAVSPKQLKALEDNIVVRILTQDKPHMSQLKEYT